MKRAWGRLVCLVASLVGLTASYSTAVACPDAGPPFATTNQCNGIQVTWGSVSGASGYDLTRMGNGSTVTVATNVAGTVFFDSTVVAGVEYNYRLRVRSTNFLTCPGGIGDPGPWSNPGERLGFPQAPSLGVFSSTCSIVLFVGSGENNTAVEIYRSTTSNINDAVQIGTATPPMGGGGPWGDPGPTTPGVPYFYWARGTGLCGNSNFVGPVIATQTGAAPAAPSPVGEPSVTCGEIKFYWDAVPNATAYTYAISPSGPGSSGTIAGTTVAYSAPDGLPRTIFVRAESGCGQSSFSAGVTASANADPLAAIGGDPNNLAVDTGETAVLSLDLIPLASITGVRWHNDNGPLFDSAHISGATTDTLTIMNCTPGDSGEYRLVVDTECGQNASAVGILAVRMTCPGDLDGSGTIDIADLVAFIEAWQPNIGQNCP